MVFELLLSSTSFWGFNIKENELLFSIARSTYLEPVPSLEVRGPCFLSRSSYVHLSKLGNQ